MIVNLETHRNSSNAAIESLNIDGRIVNNEQHIADTFNNYLADNININDNNAHTQNKYNPNSDNNNIPLQSVSQIHNSPYTKIKRTNNISLKMVY